MTNNDRFDQLCDEVNRNFSPEARAAYETAFTEARAQTAEAEAGLAGHKEQFELLLARARNLHAAKGVAIDANKGALGDFIVMKQSATDVLQTRQFNAQMLDLIDPALERLCPLVQNALIDYLRARAAHSAAAAKVLDSAARVAVYDHLAVLQSGAGDEHVRAAVEVAVRTAEHAQRDAELAAQADELLKISRALSK